MFLALVLSEEQEIQASRGLSIVLDTVRGAVWKLHEDHLASIVVNAELPRPERIVFRETRGYEWSEPAGRERVISSATPQTSMGTSSHSLRRR